MTVLLFLGSVAALMRALSLGFALNFVLPFKLGDLCRAWYAGRRMKNGVGLSLATVVVDRFLDVLAVAVLFAALWATGVRRELVWDSARFYLLAAVGVCSVICHPLLCRLFRRLLPVEKKRSRNDKKARPV